MNKTVSHQHQSAGVIDLSRQGVAHVAQIKTPRYGGSAARLVAGLLTLAAGSALIHQCPAAEQFTSPSMITERGFNSREWQRTTSETLPNGKIRNRTSGYTELATGLHYIDQQGQWQEAQELIELFKDGAIASRGQIQVIWAPNLATPGAIDLMTPDKKRLRTHVLGLALHDMATGDSELIAEVKDCLGELDPPNKVIYNDAFTSVKASVIYTYNRDMFEQDVILFERLTLPAGYNPATTRLEIWTEAIDPPIPGKTSRQVGNLTDEILDFGAMHMGAGRAFELEDPRGRGWSAPMIKQWATVENRTFLIESVAYSTVQPLLDLLPLPVQGAAVGNPPSLRPRRQMAMNAAGRRYFPARQETARVGGKIKVIEIAAIQTLPSLERGANKGLVLDYSLVTTSSNVTFKGDSTYYVSGSVNLSGTTVFEGGTVIKYAPTNNASIDIATGSMDCRTAAYRPALFTARDDSSAGEIIGTNVLSGYYATNALKLHDNFHTLSHVRISYAKEAIYMDDGILTTRHAQFTHCAKAFSTAPVSGTVIKSENCLFYMVSCVVTGGTITLYGQHVTVDQANKFASQSSSNIHVFLTNSLLVSLTNWGPAYFTTNYTIQVSDPATVFQTVGGASHYLLDNTYRNIGTTGIDSTLLSELRSGTTYPPLVFSNTVISTDTALTPQAQRDTDIPDLGYHYDPLDVVFGKVTLTNITLTLAPGTAVGIFAPNSTNGLQLVGGQIVCEGSATALNHVVRYNCVQEEANSNWTGAGASMVTAFSGTPPAASARFRFTEFGNYGSSYHLMYDYGCQDTVFNFRDCLVFGSSLYNYRASLHLTNNLFHRFSFQADDFEYGYTLSVRNCLFLGGILSLDTEAGGAYNLTDNLFDNVYVNSYGSTADYNAYTTNSTILDGSATHDVRLATNTINYQTWGANSFYLPTNSLLINTGSVASAASVGFYHYTTTTNQVKEGTNRLDIGLHYIAVTNGVPIDADGDGLADYVEDQNGNGIKNTGETGWQSPSPDADTDNDGVSDYLEILLGRNPLVAWTTNDVSGTLNLRVYTPLK